MQTYAVAIHWADGSLRTMLAEGRDADDTLYRVAHDHLAFSSIVPFQGDNFRDEWWAQWTREDIDPVALGIPASTRPIHPITIAVAKSARDAAALLFDNASVWQCRLAEDGSTSSEF